MSRGSGRAAHAPTLAFICPLYIELKAVKAIFDKDLGSQTIDNVIYHYGIVCSREAVAVQLPLRDTGPTSTATHAANMMNVHESLKERDSCYYFLVGIAGGIWSERHDVRLGDVVIATKVWDWRAGKVTETGMESTRDPQSGPVELMRRLPEFLDRPKDNSRGIADQIEKMQQKLEERDDRWEYPEQGKDILFEANYPHAGGSTCASCNNERIVRRDARADRLPQVHEGGIASGDVVLKNARHRAVLQNRNMLAVEMEASGVLDPYKFIVVRGISDYADSHKNDDWHGYAAAVAAACTRLLISFLDHNKSSFRQSSISLRPSSFTPSIGFSQPESDADPASNAPSTSEFSGSSSDLACWAPCFECKAGEVSVEVCEFANDPRPHRELMKNAHIIIEVRFHDLLDQKQQRIVIKSSMHGSVSHKRFWLPLTNVRVTRNGSHVQVEFSNCKQKVTKSVNHHESYLLDYNPQESNVKFVIACTEANNALELEGSLLHREPYSIVEMNDKAHEFRALTVCNVSADLTDTPRRKGIFVWDRSNSFSVFDMGFHSDRLDFHFEQSGSDTTVVVGNLAKIDHKPADIHLCTGWPPPEVKKNKDGSPSQTIVTDGSSPNDHLTLTVATIDVSNFLNCTIGYAISCELIGWYEIDLARPRRGSWMSRRERSSSSKSPSQLTIWYRDNRLFCLVRHGDYEDQSKKQKWTSWVLTTFNGSSGDIGGEVGLEISNTQATLKNLQAVSGDHLSLHNNDTFELRSSDQDTTSQFSNLTDFRLYFRTNDQLANFRGNIQDCVTLT